MSIKKIDNQNNKTQNVMRAAKIIGGGTAASALIYCSTDMLTRGVKYRKKVKNENDTFEKNVEEHVQRAIKRNPQENNKDFIEEITEHAKALYKGKKDSAIITLKNHRKAEFLQGLKIASGIGLSLSTITLAIMGLKHKKNMNSQIIKEPESEKVQSYSYHKTSLNDFQNPKSNKISFTGICDEIQGVSSFDQIEYLNFKQFVKCKDPTWYEKKIAQDIVNHKLSDWPKDVPHLCWLNPKTDQEYHQILIENMYPKISRPPKSYSSLDKLFGSDTYKNYQKWNEYARQALLRERMETLVNRTRLENYAKKQQDLQKQLKIIENIKYAKTILWHNVISQLQWNNKLPVKGIMIEGGSKKERKELIEWFLSESIQASKVVIADNGDSPDIRIQQILNAAEKAKTSNIHKTVLYVENFDNLINKTSSDTSTIATMKELLSDLATTYNTTLIFETEHSENLDPIALQQHRIKTKINLEGDSLKKEFDKIYKDILKENMSEINDGRRLRYIPYNNEKYVDLYLGDFGNNFEVLWIDTKDAEEINLVLENIDVVKSYWKFCRTKTAQFPEPNGEVIGDIELVLGKRTKYGERIYSVKL